MVLRWRGGSLLPRLPAGLAWTFMLAAILGGPGCSSLAAPAATSQARVAGIAGSPYASIAVGAPILAAAATGKLPVRSGDLNLTPVASGGGGLILSETVAGNRFRPSGYVIWSPAAAAQAPLVGWQPNPASQERIDGAWGDWILTEHTSSTNSASIALLLRNLQSGEVRELAQDADSNLRSGGNQISADGQVLWATDSAGTPRLHVYDIASASDTVIPTRVGAVRRFATGGGRLASVVSSSAQSPRVVVRDLKGGNGTPQSFTTGQVTSLVLSSDGRSAVWIERANDVKSELLARDLGSGTTVRVLSGDTVGAGLSVSGAYVSWQPRTAAGATTAGFYNLQTHELRLVQSPPNRMAYFAAVMGDWFIWIEGAGPATTAQPGQFGGFVTPSDGVIYALKLRP